MFVYRVILLSAVLRVHWNKFPCISEGQTFHCICRANCTARYRTISTLYPNLVSSEIFIEIRCIPSWYLVFFRIHEILQCGFNCYLITDIVKEKIEFLLFILQCVWLVCHAASMVFAIWLNIFFPVKLHLLYDL